MDLLNSLRLLGKKLLKEELSEKVKIEKALNKSLIQLRIIKTRYAGRKLAGTENVRELFLESLNLYIEGTGDFVSFLKDSKKEHISEGLFKVEEADDILAGIEELILRNKERFTEISLS
jgi:hypothetical protein